METEQNTLATTIQVDVGLVEDTPVVNLTVSVMGCISSSFLLTVDGAESLGQAIFRATKKIKDMEQNIDRLIDGAWEEDDEQVH